MRSNDFKTISKKILTITCWALFFLFTSCLLLFTSMKGFSKIPVVVLIILAFFTLLYGAIFGNFRVNAGVLFMVLFILYAYLLTFLTTKIFEPYLKTMANCVLMFLVIYNFTINFKNIRMELLIIIASSFIFAAVFLVYYRRVIFDFNLGLERFGDHFGNVNGVGFMFALSNICVLCYCLKFAKRPVLWISLSILYGFIILRTGSRLAAIMYALQLIMYIFIKFWKNHKILLLIIISLIFVLCLLILTLPVFSSISTRFLQLFELFANGNSSDASVNIRFSMFEVGFKLWSKRLIFGYGMFGFAKNTNYGGYSHNTLTEMLCDFGIFGFVLFFAAPIIYYKLSKKGSNARNILVFVIYSFILPEFIGSVIFDEKMYYFLLAIALGFFNIEKEKNDVFINFSFSNRKISFNRKLLYEKR